MKDINNEFELEYYCDEQRHLVCVPYNIENLHIMARDLGIKPCHFHRKRKAHHYDIPKMQFKQVLEKCNLVNRRDIARIYKGEFTPSIT